jgi:hypothetical protein
MAGQVKRGKAEALKQRIKARQMEKEELSRQSGRVSKWKMIWKKPGQAMSASRNSGL